MSISNRYDFALLFDVKDGNPNGDPDAGNLPRIDAETGRGLVTDVCLKRKVRNYVQITREFKRPNDIYVKEKSVLGRVHVEAFKELGIGLGEETRNRIPDGVGELIEDFDLPDGMSVEEDDAGNAFLVVASDADVKMVKDYLKDAKPSALLKKFLTDSLKGVKARKPSGEETAQGREWMCENFYDIRTFGAVMSLKSAPNCGQVRGPVQITFARSIDPIVASEHSITRMAVATEAEAIKQSGDNRTMGRKFTVPYGLYVAHGFISAHLADQTGFSEEDLSLLWESLQNMFEHDRSAARGLMNTRALYIFKHESKLGNAPAHSLFDRVQIVKKSAGPARDYSDYEVSINDHEWPEGVSLIRPLG
ncbi:type I-C CRISPR-associated protein Cas7/Csd2 [Rheinheimera sediminis]|uniref:type I-C CRISPR-associated protein Cas7/Csd2 n=1 Tax=Rheinheimera sp. YQF-1 TaxID=2499626 RepID=UPI000FD9C404|nr:type I-C CRISPR-associated protein Cas7/Csd2 [Rheinheimera sp. YQF-1]RVT40634.1 type I-C CRISPR-associated protein Cas7/Csd2 [Rheinheimera sp. YQF-1]